MSAPNPFLPPGYAAPQSGGKYVKLEDGANRFRILSAATLGWVEWGGENKPHRYRFEAKPLDPLNPDRPPRHFWTVIVWNYATGSLGIWEFTQATIQRAIENFMHEPEYGDPRGYDVKVTKTGSGKNTEYVVMAAPPRPIDKEIAAAARDAMIDLDALFDGGDPFAAFGQGALSWFDGAERFVAGKAKLQDPDFDSQFDQ